MFGVLFVLRTTVRGIRRVLADPQGRGLLILGSSLLLAGRLVYRWIEDLSWLDSFYLATMTLTTIGFGDVTPQTAVGKVFTMVYALVGIGVFVALAGEVAANVIAGRNERRSGSD